MRIAISTYCFRSAPLEELCTRALATGADTLELGVKIKYADPENLLRVLELFSDRLSFEVHNYFPPSTDSFVLNLGHPDHLERSKRHIREAIDFCAAAGIARYSIHAGYAVATSPEDLGREQSHLARIPVEESLNLVLEALLELDNYTASKGVRLLLENNVVAPFNLDGGRADSCAYHLCGFEKLSHLERLFGTHHRMLADMGHLKVSARTLGFDLFGTLDTWAPWIEAVHLSDNDGLSDDNRPFRENSWFWIALKKLMPEYISLELRGLSEESLADQVTLVRQKLAPANKIISINQRG